MNAQQARSSLQKLKQRYILLRLVEITFLSGSASLLAFAFLNLLSIGFVLKISLVLFCGIAAVVLASFHYRLPRLGSGFFTGFLNQQFPQLHESADLLLRADDSLSTLQQMQKVKTLSLLNQILPEVKLPHRILQSMLVFLISVGLHLGLSSLAPMSHGRTKPTGKEGRSHDKVSPIYIKSFTLLISPPPYTHVRPYASSDLNLTVPEGTSVKWRVEFSGRPSNARIFFSGKDSVDFSNDNSLTYFYERTLQGSGFYQMQWQDDKKVYRSDFYKIEIIKDLPPKIAVKDLNQFTKLKFTDKLDVILKSELTDDYGVSDAQIVATVSKGSGEGVKFREEKLRFLSPASFVGKKLDATRVLDLKKLGLEPADELYFYVEAWDSKSPSPNRSRTETFFIAIQDTAQEITSVDAGLGVDLMPEYFRSQRQIIIDTEKLLRDKKNISAQQFNFTSNELGYDQKALRLRYGQFLGEEDEAGIGQPSEEQEAEESDPLKKVTHQHDTKNEHNLVDQKSKQHQHAAEENGEEAKNPLKQFVHEHDNTEEATFFIQSLKTKLKAAITQMWDAELYLRLYTPEKSLPYQYRALNLLKEISSDSRIFVHRSGFDPPPLKEEKRLAADLSEVKSQSNILKSRAEEKWVGVRAALSVVERMIDEDSVTVSTENQKTFHQAGQELAELASAQPLTFLKGLSLLKSLSEEKSRTTKTELAQLRAILWKALPVRMSSPSQRQSNGHVLNKQFLIHLDQRKYE
ncbi:MAG TPA: hypothetical protein VL728_19815 [Cyclobacteriaceae bacterium]|nr:hypothetical protein [Cyclobacteriaceae bacterium]